ncbi:hypothetical protein BLNAU_12838 [Blattamonas nauphoetae]|uniref:Uncharacterized protein n=1 Tax=Blattamonas nauphoetae TaxID=2049346 RepID=A0ABQ9XKL9_9EUKA|nr:hypothetical protein BLNAU_12838 [Blattamonas nauphoetae]
MPSLSCVENEKMLTENSSSWWSVNSAGLTLAEVARLGVGTMLKLKRERMTRKLFASEGVQQDLEKEERGKTEEHMEEKQKKDEKKEEQKRKD